MQLIDSLFEIIHQNSDNQISLYSLLCLYYIFNMSKWLNIEKIIDKMLNSVPDQISQNETLFTAFCSILVSILAKYPCYIPSFINSKSFYIVYESVTINSPEMLSSSFSVYSFMFPNSDLNLVRRVTKQISNVLYECLSSIKASPIIIKSAAETLSSLIKTNDDCLGIMIESKALHCLVPFLKKNNFFISWKAIIDLLLNCVALLESNSQNWVELFSLIDFHHIFSLLLLNPTSECSNCIILLINNIICNEPGIIESLSLVQMYEIIQSGMNLFSFAQKISTFRLLYTLVYHGVVQSFEMIFSDPVYPFHVDFIEYCSDKDFIFESLYNLFVKHQFINNEFIRSTFLQHYDDFCIDSTDSLFSKELQKIFWKT